MKTSTKTKIKSKRKKGNPFKISWNGVPAMLKSKSALDSLYGSIVKSFISHVAFIFIISLITFSVLFFGISPKLFPKPEPKISDIEFVIKNKSGNRIKSQNIVSVPNKINIEKNKPQKQLFEPTSQTGNPKKNSKKANVSASGSTSEIPDFDIPIPNLKSMSSGLGSSGKIRTRVSGGDSSTSSINNFTESSYSGENVSGSSGFNKVATKKIITSYDISPYVNELKRNVRWNWKAPQGYENKKVELFLRIAKDGKVMILNVKKTSEVGEVDNAALNAVRKCFPLNPLPAKYNKSYLDLIFTFNSDSDSIGSRY